MSDGPMLLLGALACWVVRSIRDSHREARESRKTYDALKARVWISSP